MWGRAADSLACSVSLTFLFEDVVPMMLKIYCAITLSFFSCLWLGSRDVPVYLQYSIYWRPCYSE
jgi:hypothetical protein